MEHDNINKGISIIMPVYNAEKYLEKCLDSLFSQTFKKSMEYIFVLDKNSTDSSEKILKNSSKDMSNVKIIKPTDGNGAGFNRNIALEHVSKDYIGFCDSDDWMDPDFYERLYDFAQIYNADIAIGSTLLINDLDKNIFNKAEFPFSVEYRLGKVFQKLKWNTVWDKIYRTKMVLENEEIRFPEGVIHEDNLFLINAVYKANKVVMVPGSYYYWRRYPDSVSSIPNDSSKYVNDAYIVFSRILNSLYNMDVPIPEKEQVIHQVMGWAKQTFCINEEKSNYLNNKIKEITRKD